MSRLRDPALTAFTFAPTGSAEARGLASTWRAYGDKLGLDAPLLDNLPVDWPDGPPRFGPSGRARIVAARRRELDGELAEAVAIAAPNGIGVGLALGRTGLHGSDAWADLVGRWRAVPTERAGLCLVARAEGAVPAADEVRAVLRSARLDLWRDPVAGGPDVWRWDWWSEELRLRLVVAVAGPNAGPSLDARVWGETGQPPKVPPLAYAWLNAALLDDQRQVLQRLDEAVRDGSGLVIGKADPGRLRSGAFDALDEVDAQLCAAGDAVGDLIDATSRLRDVRRAVLSLATNLDQLAGALAPLGDGGVFAADRADAELLVQQAEQTIEHAESARQRAESQLAVLRNRLTLSQNALLGRQRRLELVQTTVLAALLAALGALSTLQITLKPPTLARWPLVGTLITAATAAPLLVGYWHRRRLPVAVCAVAALAAGCAVATALLWSSRSGGLAVGVGLVAGLVTGAWLWWLKVRPRSGH